MLNVKSFIFNPFSVNTYVVSEEKSREAVLIDPGCRDFDEWSQIEEYIQKHFLQIKYIFLTHCHIDHLMGCNIASKSLFVDICGSLDELNKIPSIGLQARLFGINFIDSVIEIKQNVKEGDSFIIGNEQIKVLDVPGHSFHGLIYYFPNSHILFSGDVLFRGSVGRSDFGPIFGCDGNLLIKGIREKLLILPPYTKIYPGHGNETTIAFELQTNPYI